MALKVKLFVVPEMPSKVLLKFVPFSMVGTKILKDFFVGDWREFNHELGAWEFEVTALEKIRRIFDPEGTLEYDDGVARVFGQLDSHKRGAGKAAPVAMDFSDYKFKTAPYSHQAVCFHMGRKVKAFALLMEMGCGKGKSAIDMFSFWVGRGETDGALIVCPKSMLYTWEREIETHSPLAPEKRRTVVLAGDAKEKLHALAMGANVATFFIATYQTVVNLFVEFTRLMKRRRLGMACDESTRIKTHTSKRFKACRDLGKMATHRLILTGSPIGNLPLDAFGQFYFLDPNILGHASFTSFKAEHALILNKTLAGGRPHPLNNKLITGYKNLERLAAKIRPHSYRVLKKECLDLPEKIYRNIELEMGDQQRSFYNQMKEESLIELTHLKNACDCGDVGGDMENLNVTTHAPACMRMQPVVLTAPHILTRTTRLAQLTGGFYPVMGSDGKPKEITFFEDNPKLDAVMETLEDAVEQGHKAIVWCRFLPEIQQLARRLGEVKLGTVLFTGDTDERERDLRIWAFQERADVNVFVGQIQAGGMGITLTAASKVLYYSNTLSLDDRLQSEDRAHRIGQKQDVEYFDFSYRRSVDMSIRKALRAKKNFADIITGDNIRKAYEGELNLEDAG